MKSNLTPKVGLGAVAEIRRWHQLNDQKILTPGLEAERDGIKKHIHSIVTEHADELLACWSAVRFEYEPLVGSIARILERVDNLRRGPDANQVDGNGAAIPAVAVETETKTKAK